MLHQYKIMQDANKNVAYVTSAPNIAGTLHYKSKQSTIEHN